MKHIRLFEEYSEEHYNRVLDLYNEVGLEGMTPEEIAYMKRGGEIEAPKSLFQKKIMGCPFVVTLAEDIWRRYFNDDFGKDGEGVNKPWTAEGEIKFKEFNKDKNYSYKTFVFKNYKPININDKNRNLINSINWDSDYFHERWKPNGIAKSGPYKGLEIDGPEGQRWSDNDMERMALRYFHDNYEEGVVFWYFDCQFPKYTQMWNDWVEDGGLLGQSGGSSLIKREVKNAFGYEVPEEKFTIKMFNTLEIDLKGQPLTLEVLIKEINRAEMTGNLGDWVNDSDKLLGGERYLPLMSGIRLFNSLYK